MKARDLMTADPVCCTPGDTAEHAARQMIAADCGCLPVVEDLETGRIVGVVTDRDLASRCIAEGRGPDTPIRDVMTASPSCCTVDQDVQDVERVMADRQLRRIPIVNEEDRCVGMIAQADIARADSDFDDHEVRRTIERISEPTHREQSRRMD